MSGCENVDKELEEILDDKAEEAADLEHEGPYEIFTVVPEGQSGGETVATVAEEERNLPTAGGSPENFEMPVVSLIDNVSFLSFEVSQEKQK